MRGAFCYTNTKSGYSIVVSDLPQETSNRIPDDLEIGTEPHLDYVYDIYLPWSVLPPEERSPATVEDFSHQYKVTMRQIADFKERQGHWEAYMKHTKNWGRSKMAGLMHNLWRDIQEDPKSKDVERFNSIVNDKSDNDGGTVNNTVINVSEDQYSQILKREQARQEEERGITEGKVLDSSSSQ